MTYILPHIRTISDLARQAREIVDNIRQSGEPVVITQRGREAVVMIRAEDYRQMVEEMTRLEDARFMAAMEEAEEEIAAGVEAIPYGEVRDRLESEWAKRAGN